MAHVPKKTHRPGFTPKFRSIRWTSLFECVNFISDHMSSYKKSRLPKVQNALADIEKKIGWTNLLNILQIMVNFVKSLEKDRSTIAEIFPFYHLAHSQLIKMNHPASIALAKYLKQRFTKTCSLQLPICAYLLTKDGLEYYRNNKNDQEILKSAKKGIKGYMKERCFLQTTIQANKASFINYLNNFDINKFNEFPTAYDMWNQFCLSLSNKTIPILFSHLAIELLSIPASEAAVERVFSALSKVTTPEMCNILPETINARLTIKYDSIFSKSGKVTWESLVEDAEKALKLNEIDN